MVTLREKRPDGAATALAAVLLLVAGLQPCSSQSGHIICNNTGLAASGLYIMRPGSEYCYRLFQSDKDFSDANRTCYRQNGLLVKIDSRSENEFIYNEYFVGGGRRDFWIGLNDQDQEGVFRWIEGNTILEPATSFNNWSSGYPIDNSEGFDCVKFTADGWRVHQGFCASSALPFLCRQRACNSSDGVMCDAPVAPAFSPVIIAVIVIIVVVIIIVVAVLLFLVWLWKFRNDAFYHYVCCCVYGGTKSQINSLQQENQRLRHELSQQKLSSSARFSQGMIARQQSQAAMSPTKSPIFPIPEEPRAGATQLPPMMHSLSSSRIAPVPIRSPSIGSAYGPAMGGSMMARGNFYSRQPTQRAYNMSTTGPVHTILPRASVPSFPEKPLVFGGVGKGPLPLPTKIDERPGSASSQSTDSSSATSTSSKIGEDAKE